MHVAGWICKHITLLPLLCLPGCLTRALWHVDPPTDTLATTVVPFTVTEVRGRLADAEHGSRIELRARVTGTPPPHLAPWSERTCKVTLRPDCSPAFEWHRQPGARLFEPRSFTLQVRDGSYFRALTMPVRLVLHGELKLADVVQVTPEERAPPSWRRCPPFEPDPDDDGPAARCIAAFRAHRWTRLIDGYDHAPPDSVREEPIAILDGQGMFVAFEQLNTMLGKPPRAPSPEVAAYGMLGRLTTAAGTVRYVRVPLPVLLQGTDLHLEAHGDRVAWAHEQSWGATIVDGEPTTELAMLDVRLEADRFDYLWNKATRHEVHPVIAQLDFMTRVLLTPVTAAVDIVVMTNPPLRALVRLFAPDEPALQEPQVQIR